jgi:hypothetical protein
MRTRTDAACSLIHDMPIILYRMQFDRCSLALTGHVVTQWSTDLSDGFNADT